MGKRSHLSCPVEFLPSPESVLQRSPSYWLLLIFTLVFSLLVVPQGTASSPADPSEELNAQIRTAMLRATKFMMDEVSLEGGFVWYTLPDFSRRWGELEANATSIWIQPPGTATVGHLLLDAWTVTQDPYYLDAAQRVADVLIKAQHASGGWNYLHDLAGAASEREWYERVGSNAWRLEEFQHYLGNATFDDAGTYEATVFFLRLAASGAKPRHQQALDRAIQFILDSQYPNGGWPQRYPPVTNSPIPYADYVTFNDGVTLLNIRVLLAAYQLMDKPELRDAALRGMQTLLDLWQGPAQPGWALQYDSNGKPAAGRSYEPASLSSSMSATNVFVLTVFYRITGDQRFLEPIPDTLRWLDELALPPESVVDGRTHPRIIELGTNKPLYLYRRGSNAHNGEYYTQYVPGETVIHYPSTGRIDVSRLRALYEQALAFKPEADFDQRLAVEELLAIPRLYISRQTLGGIDGTERALSGEPLTQEQAATLVGELNARGYWPTLRKRSTNPPGTAIPLEPAVGNFQRTWVGDRSDTSPFVGEVAQEVIATDVYVANMTRLLRFLDSAGAAAQLQ